MHPRERAGKEEERKFFHSCRRVTARCQQALPATCVVVATTMSVSASSLRDKTVDDLSPAEKQLLVGAETFLRDKLRNSFEKVRACVIRVWATRGPHVAVALFA